MSDTTPLSDAEQGHMDGPKSRELRERINRLEADRAQAFREITRNTSCEHLADDGSDDCANEEDCLRHTLLRLTAPLPE